MGATVADRQITIESTSRAIVRCDNRACRTARRVDFTTRTTTWARDGRPVTNRTVFVPRTGNWVSYRDRYDIARLLVGSDWTCGECGHGGYTWKVVEGRFSETVKCGARCRCAVGPSCDCQCGGENHASGHAVVA